ncbi:hypothetical protein FH972_008132 [Carpinus fangiana]|uniref:GRF-type domain-containing protein n=1 Tax=Carpinus fangiana TaxID=176857 RepID=A0A5N6R137_9ROSI|nr:hypothetical protein FH972_008132 [Carpinus fangiana]
MSDRSSIASGHGHQEMRVCFCGLPCPLRTSSSKDNRGRRYFGCPKFKDGTGTHCKFLDWIDDPINDHTCAMLSELKTKNKLLEDQLCHKEAVESRLHFLLIALCGLCLALSSMLMYVIFGVPQGIDRRRLPL